jgi:hypothetical protein
MLPQQAASPTPLSAAALRQDLNARAAYRALRLGLPHELTSLRCPSVIFGEDESGHHGNFHPASYQAICARPDWARRLGKVHTASRRAMPRANWRWRELDCASSSDALLMNIFCHPGTFDAPDLAALLGVGHAARPRFGVKARVPLQNGLFDATEIDMELGSLLVEAKLTESHFQTARPSLVERYRDLACVFDPDRLPLTRSLLAEARWDEARFAMVEVVRRPAGHYAGYQLIRNTLAAHARGAAFCVLADGRRLDLIEAWHRVLRAVRDSSLRCRLQLLTWQELATVLPAELQHFLDDKYGILPARQQIRLT